MAKQLWNSQASESRFLGDVMGDVIRKISEITIGKEKFDIELNHSARGSEYRDIHIQNDKFRLEIPENEFLQMASCIILAKRQFEVIKGLEAEKKDE